MTPGMISQRDHANDATAPTPMGLRLGRIPPCTNASKQIFIQKILAKPLGACVHRCRHLGNHAVGHQTK